LLFTGSTHERVNIVNIEIKSGVAIPVLLMLPNVAWMLLYKDDAGVKSAVPRVVSIAENVARFVKLAVPCFYSLQLVRNWSRVIVAIGIVCALGVYYLAWARFFANGGRVSLLSASLFGIPSPLALARNV
jgi:hypothetical protein